MDYKKKLIEVALPLEAINTESAREKSIRHGHPSTLHLWWARRPLAAARAVIFSSLVDDPSSHGELFPTEEEQNIERQRLFKIIEELVKWENSNNPAVLDAAKAEIMKSTDNNPPALLDPFAGGGAIPLEAQRLGLEAHASDLNPVAVMINKAMIEIPPKFAGMPPVNPDARRQLDDGKGWQGAAGLADDVRYYGEWMKQEAYKRIGHLYPKVKDERGQEHTVIAWIWARTVKCPNPACGCQMPLVRSFELSKKAGSEVYVQPNIKATHVTYETKQGKGAPEGTISRKGARCICCGSPVGFPYIREESREGRMKSALLAIVGEGKNGRYYVSPNKEHVDALDIQRPVDCDLGELSYYPGYINPVAYGFNTLQSIFTNRQLSSISIFCELINEVRESVIQEAAKEISLIENNDANVYGSSVATYLAFAIDKMVDYNSSICSWNAARDGLRNTFGLTGMSMSWDYAEANPFSNSSGCFENMLMWITKCICALPAQGVGIVRQFDAQSDIGLRDIMVSTDPPYYSNVPYAAFSDLFYSWMKRSLKDIYPKIFRTLLTPKNDELIANPYLAGSKEKANAHFEDGMLEACKKIRLYVNESFPVTIYYAFKQSESEDDDRNGQQTASSGWETMLTAVIRAGFTITGTWPINTERTARTRSVSSNALASSIVLVCRKRPEDAPVCTRRDFINALKRELKPALKELQRSNIAPVDLAQSAIGPGMGVYSRYSKVLEADGSAMSVRSALQIINQELDLYFTEQDGELDRDSRFCVELYSQYAFNTMRFGEADVLARAKNTSVEKLAAHGVLYAQKGDVRLLTREEIPESVNSNESIIWLLCQQLTRAMETGGIMACAEILKDMFGSNAEHAKALAYRLFTIAENKRWAQEAYAYNSLVIAWPEIQSKAAELQSIKPEQLNLFSGGTNSGEV